MTPDEIDEAGDLARDIARAALEVLDLASSWTVAACAVEIVLETVREAARREGHPVGRITVKKAVRDA